MTTIQHQGNDPLHDLAGYRSDELYFLPDGKAVTKKSWDGPLIGWDFAGAVYVEDLTGILDKVECDREVCHLGYASLSKDFTLSYAKVDGEISADEFAVILERLRQDGYAVGNFSLVDGVFWVNHSAPVEEPTSEVVKSKVLDTDAEQA